MAPFTAQGRKRWGAALLLVAWAAGCSSSPTSSPFSVFETSNQLSPAAKDLRRAVAVPAPVPRELAKSVLPSYVVEPGDVLLVQPVDLDSPVRLPADQPVLLDGTIDLGLYGRPVVAGMTLPQIEALARDLILAREKARDPKASTEIMVRLVSRVSKVFYVLGEVNSPGAFPLSGRETALDAIIVAGGLTRRASEKNIILSRPTPPDGCRIVLPVCYRDIVQVGDTSTNYQLAPGDRIYVPGAGMLEQVCPDSKKCDPCNRSHFPCDLGSGCYENCIPASTFRPAVHP